jgi:hypothetical protein
LRVAAAECRAEAQITQFATIKLRGSRAAVDVLCFPLRGPGLGGGRLRSRGSWTNRFGDYLVATCDAVRKLMRTMALELAALGVRIGLVVDERGWELIGGSGA